MILTRIPRDIPVFAGLLTGLGLLVFGFTTLFLDPRPSSTAGLGVIFIPLWSLVLGAAGYGAGLVVRSIWKRLIKKEANAHRHSLVLLGVLLLSLPSVSLLGWWQVIRFEKASRPAVIIDEGSLERSFASNSDSLMRLSNELYRFHEAPQTITWGENNTEVVIGKSKVYLRETKLPRPEVVVVTTGLDYITRIDAVPFFTRAGSDPSLAVVICGRATGRRAVVLVLAPDYTVKLEERLERFWQPDQRAVEIRKDLETGAEKIAIGPECQKSLILAAR